MTHCIQERHGLTGRPISRRIAMGMRICAASPPQVDQVGQSVVCFWQNTTNGVILRGHGRSAVAATVIGEMILPMRLHSKAIVLYILSERTTLPLVVIRMSLLWLGKSLIVQALKSGGSTWIGRAMISALISLGVSSVTFISAAHAGPTLLMVLASFW